VIAGVGDSGPASTAWCCFEGPAVASCPSSSHLFEFLAFYSIHL